MKIVKTAQIFIILFFYISITSAQTKFIDSLIDLSKQAGPDTVKIKLYGDISWELMAVDITQALTYAEKELTLAVKAGNKALIAQAESDIGNVLNRKSDFDSALVHYQKAADLRAALKQPVKVAGIYSNMATVYMRQNKFEEAMKLDFKSLAKFEEAKDVAKQAIILGNIGNLYYEMEQNKQAKVYFIKSLALARESHNPGTEANALMNLGGIYYETNQVDSALFVFRQAETILLANNQTYNLGAIYNNIGKILAKQEKYDEAIRYYEKALANRIQFQDKYAIGLSHLAIGDLYKKEKKFAEAIKHLEESAGIFLQSHSLINLKQTYLYLAQAYEDEGNLAQSVKYYKSYNAYKDSVYTKETSDKLVEMNTKYETEKKEQENKLLHAKNELSEENVKKQKLFTVFIAVALVFVGAIAFLVFRGLRQQRKANITITRQKHEVEIKNHIIEEKQKEILDSIHYAKRIQNAVVSSDSYLSQFLKNYFVMFQPKDIVSGDFYWATEYNNCFYLAVCDSTGHGVPGAFMSILNIGFLSEAINEKNITQPNLVFNYVRNRLIEGISKEGQKDGFDGILLCIDMAAKKITYAAAYNAPVVINNSLLTELDCDKMPVGKGEKTDSFNLYTVDLKEGDTLYAYTDGFADQFGGPKGKKFKYKQLNETLIALSTKPLSEQKNSLTGIFTDWKGLLEQTDDVLLFGIKL